MSSQITDIPARAGNIVSVTPEPERKPLTKKEIAADHPTFEFTNLSNQRSRSSSA